MSADLAVRAVQGECLIRRAVLLGSEIEPDNLYVFWSIKNFIGKQFLGENSESAISKSKNQSQHSYETYQNENPNDQIGDVVSGIQSRWLIPGDVGVVIH